MDIFKKMGDVAGLGLDVAGKGVGSVIDTGVSTVGFAVKGAGVVIDTGVAGIDFTAEYLEESKNNIFTFISNNIDAINNRVAEEIGVDIDKMLSDLTEEIVYEKALSVIHSLFPFPLSMIPEVLFVAFGKKYILTISRMLRGENVATIETKVTDEKK